MHRQSIPNLVYRHLYPSARANDPNCFAMHLTRNLIPEVRAETSTFYGALDSVEARYPGLDYTHPPHRMRLGRFVHHRRLFRAFDELGLTDDEILGLCRWEGTRWARESYEKQEGVKVRDTTGDEIGPWVEPSKRSRPTSAPAVQVEVERVSRGAAAGDECIDEAVDDEGEGEEVDDGEEREEEEEVDDDADDAVVVEGDDDDDDDDEGTVAVAPDDVDAADESADEDEEDEEPLESVGIELNQRLNAAAAAREHGEEVVMDEAYEQWLKEATERGSLVDPTLAAYSSIDPRMVGIRMPAPSSNVMTSRLGRDGHPTSSVVVVAAAAAAAAASTASSRSSL